MPKDLSISIHPTARDLTLSLRGQNFHSDPSSSRITTLVSSVGILRGVCELIVVYAGKDLEGLKSQRGLISRSRLHA